MYIYDTETKQLAKKIENVTTFEILKSRKCTLISFSDGRLATTSFADDTNKFNPNFQPFESSYVDQMTTDKYEEYLAVSNCHGDIRVY